MLCLNLRGDPDILFPGRDRHGLLHPQKHGAPSRMTHLGPSWLPHPSVVAPPPKSQWDTGRGNKEGELMGASQVLKQY